jgi:hypothetical protein
MTLNKLVPICGRRMCFAICMLIASCFCSKGIAQPGPGPVDSSAYYVVTATDLRNGVNNMLVGYAETTNTNPHMSIEGCGRESYFMFSTHMGHPVKFDAYKSIGHSSLDATTAKTYVYLNGLLIDSPPLFVVFRN